MNTAERLLLAALLLIAAAATSSARADCALSSVAFFPDRNDRVHIRVETDAESYCDNSFREGPGYQFTSVSVAKAPRYGLVATLGPNHFAYHAFANYKGPDQYMIRACAIVGQRKGCSTLIYDVTIR
jgi:hypothetical protein